MREREGDKVIYRYMYREINRERERGGANEHVD